MTTQRNDPKTNPTKPDTTPPTADKDTMKDWSEHKPTTPPAPSSEDTKKHGQEA